MCPEERSHNTSPLFCFLKRRRFFSSTMMCSGSAAVILPVLAVAPPKTMSQINPYSLQADYFGSCVIGVER